MRHQAPLLIVLVLAGSARADEIEPVIVTATRAPVVTLDYPGSASRLDADAIAAVGVTHSSELLNRAPGSFLQRGSGEEVLVAIRSPVLTGAGACGEFLVLEDGVPIRPIGFCNVNELFEVNLEQAAAVEVLRGPGTGILGANAVHGVVNSLPATPRELPDLGVTLSTGSDDYREVALATRWLGTATRAGLAGHFTHDGGFRVASGFDESKANATVEHDFPTGQLSLALAATRLEQDTAGFIGGLDAYKDPALARSNPNAGAFRDANSERLIATWRGSGSFEAKAYLRSSRMHFVQHFLLGQPLEYNGQDSGGALLAWHGAFGRATWRAGVDLELARGTLTEIQPTPTTGGSPAANAIRPAGLHYDYVVDSQLAAPWAYAEWPLAAHVSLTTALRAEHLRYAYDNHMINGNTDANGVPCGFGGCLYSRPADRRDSFGNVAPRLGLTWRYADGQAAYAALGRGFRPPEATELYRLQRQQSFADLGSERIDSIEVGIRGAAARVRYDLAAFHMDKRDVLLRDANGFNIDRGRTRHDGVEYALGFTPLAMLALDASGTLARHTYRFSSKADGGETIIDGRDVDTAPRDLHSVRATLRPGAAAQLELEWLHVGPYYADAANLQRYPGHDLLNLRASVALGRFTLRARVLNLADRAYADRADFAFGSWRYFPGRPRTWFIDVAYAAPGGSPP